MPRVWGDMVGLLGTVMSKPSFVRSYLRGKWGSGMALLKGRRTECMVKAGRFKKICSVKLEWGEVGRI